LTWHLIYLDESGQTGTNLIEPFIHVGDARFRDDHAWLTAGQKGAARELITESERSGPLCTVTINIPRQSAL
jgi:hypothetical protein